MRNGAKWTLLGTIVLLAILIPFGIWGDAIDQWVAQFVEQSREAPLRAALVLGGLLAGDIILPTPSSLLSTACGAICGFLPGLLASWLGMNIACLLGYLLGRYASHTRVRQLMGESNMLALEKLNQRHGQWVVAITRPIPILAEAAVLFAGLGQQPMRPFILMTTAANLGISAVYAAVGARASTANGFLIAVGAAMLMPGLLMLGRHVVSGRRRQRDVQPQQAGAKERTEPALPEKSP